MSYWGQYDLQKQTDFDPLLFRIARYGTHSRHFVVLAVYIVCMHSISEDMERAKITNTHHQHPVGRTPRAFLSGHIPPNTTNIMNTKPMSY